MRKRAGGRRAARIQKRNQKGSLTVNEAGKKGGEVTSSRYGHEFYQEIGSKGGETTSSRYGGDYFERIGRKGGKAPHSARGLAGRQVNQEAARKGAESKRSLVKKMKRLVRLD